MMSALSVAKSTSTLSDGPQQRPTTEIVGGIMFLKKEQSSASVASGVSVDTGKLAAPSDQISGTLTTPEVTVVGDDGKPVMSPVASAPFPTTNVKQKSGQVSPPKPKMDPMLASAPNPNQLTPAVNPMRQRGTSSPLVG